MTAPSPRAPFARAAARMWSTFAVTGALVAGLMGGQPAWGVESDPPPEPTGSISGVVTTESGASTNGVTVTSYRYNAERNSWTWGPWASVGADDGAYELSGLPDGEYRIEFRAQALITNLVSEWWSDAADLMSATTITVSSGAAITGVDASLATGGTITGTVVDEAGAPVPQVSVRASGSASGAGSGYTITDSNGFYRVAGLRTGDYRVEFAPMADSGPVAGEWWNDAPSAAEADVVAVTAGAETPGIDAVLAGAGAIAGVVTDESGAPASYVYVAVYRATSDGAGEWVRSMTTDASGAYTISGLAAGAYKVLFSASGPLLSEWYDDAADAASAAVVAVSAGKTAAVDGALAVGASITGVVTDESGSPVENVVVWAHRVTENGLGPGAGAATGADGAYSLVGLPSGRYKLYFETANAASNLVGEWWDDAIGEADATVISVQNGGVTTDVSPRLAPGAELSGVVRDGDGEPLVDAEVALRDVDGTWIRNVYTGPDGAYALKGVGAGSYRVVFRASVDLGAFLSEWWNNAPDFASANDVVVAAGQTVDTLDATLSVDDGSVLETYSASLSGVVTDALGNPLEGVSVSVDGGDWGDGAQTDANGAWSMTSLPAGSYRVSFTAEIDGTLFTEWWDGAADHDSATVISLVNAEQRTGIDAVLGTEALPPLESSTPKITGPLRIGKTVKAHPRGWTEGAQFSYQWFADDVPIPNATAASLGITPDLVGARLTVAVTGSLAGYQSVTETSAKTAPVPAK